ncbi:unnamed protein product [Ceutorhynchus assimilis]|uniref:SWIM-type domain-containing protein n=1 Tax=Ceutorhynchus assimilis TaxID=467358 RepID=A0A9N9MJF2_9CUCU|nr:unnamed protein product [Ceutorhynchus assimilis]
MTLEYHKFLERSKNITEVIQVDEKTFNVQSEQTLEHYVVDSEIRFCTCPSGSGGRFCKHLLAVENKYGIMFKSSLPLSEKDRQQLVYLALGKKVPLSFFEDISAPAHEKSSNENTSDQTASEQVKLGVSSQFNMPIDQMDLDNYNNIVYKINYQFTRIGQVLQSDANTSHIPQLQRTSNTYISSRKARGTYFSQGGKKQPYNIAFDTKNHLQYDKK